ncbi:bifunctional chorismate mutase/prephenate dehydratase [Subdoligranulum variabile]|uniref:Bifunctional chorismate mutase/prephenate dehydratase n=1 Tax=Subdoligranulum variabile DSM 15176 TaxID=411471 RepID=D1PJK3_9FIRM|nr:prephenate dehydratase domain-containing protein [Subdoligranulum variabile]EFB76951.1 chorismate mutase [Subdoligranulum variabile DSM 15176]UWP67621.1 chorismate mutase [Subdoligranulum variabile]
MDLLQQARTEIDAIDAQMATLFERRMRAVADVARYKAQTGKPVFDAVREAAVLDKNTARLQDEALRPYYRTFLQEAMAVSRAYQRAMLGRDTAAYQGVQGAWSHIALRRLFPFSRTLSFATWGEVFDAVQNGDAEFGVLPFENSNAGDVSTVLDLLYTHPGLIVARMCDLPIRQDLLGVPGASLAGVRTVISHPQALAQSSVFLQQHGLATQAWSNTADAARHIAELNDPSVAAIASAETADLYGLKILAAGVNADGDNTTRFIVIERADEAPVMTGEGQRLALLFTARHEPGQLAAVLDQIGARGFNMECIKSRPLPHVPFEYYFYVQLVCPAGSTRADCEALLDTLRTDCSTLRLVGAFTLDTAEK